MDSATVIDHDANHILNAPGRKTRHPVTQNPGKAQYRKLGIFENEQKVGKY
jgi:hypothetical protein